MGLFDKIKNPIFGIDQSGSRDPGRTYHNSGIDRTFRTLEQNETCGGWDILTRASVKFYLEN